MPMNMLNSSILEGSVIENGGLSSDKTRVELVIETIRYSRHDGEEERMLFPILYTGNLPELIAEVKPGRGCRIVGRLSKRNVNGGQEVLIVAEHIEIKPEFNSTVNV